jgi:hypothetical protein
MQRASLAPRVTRRFRQYLGENLFWIRASGDQMSVIAMRAVDIVAFIQASYYADSGRFLADIDVIMTRHLALVRRLNARLFQAADNEHLSEGVYAAFSG